VSIGDAPTLETARLRLRPFRLDDFDHYAGMWAEPVVVHYIAGGVPFTREASWARFLRHVGMWHYLGYGSWVIEDRVTGAYAGECGFHDLHRPLTPSLEGTMEAGWALRGEMQGQGRAKEAMRAALSWAIAERSGTRLTCIVDPGNAPSLRVAARLGYREFARTTYNGKPVVLFEHSGND
jgi:RimJ/RimL family protein N-acetyltransferase